MHLLYYDEVKYDPPEQKFFWLGGVCVNCDAVPLIEAEMNAIASDAFGSGVLSKSTEIHGIELCRGKGNFKGIPLGDRLELLKRILAVATRDDVHRVYVRIIPENITHSTTPPQEIAFMYLVEQANAMFKRFGTKGMMFGDYDEPNVGASVASLSRYRQGGTEWRQGRSIDHIIDTVHFARSHHSRMVQLADVFLYCLQFCLGKNDSGWRSAIHQVIWESNVTDDCKARIWPINAVWYRG